MKQIMKFFESFFDEDSGNTREEGIKQVEKFLMEELKLYSKNCKNLKENIEEILR